MDIVVSPSWEDYELIDSGFGKRYERFGPFKLIRPDPQIIWEPLLPESEWNKADAFFESRGEKGKWIVKNKIPEKWLMKYKNLSFWGRLTPFKHTGVFPEQAAQWEWISEQIKKEGRQLNLLNLFGYTGIASLVALENGAKVTHIDASKPALSWTKENQIASGLAEKPLRLIPEDALKFVEREIKRGNKYDAIIMDPPVYGHGPSGEVWNFNRSFPELINACKRVLSDNPVFILINAYAISSSALMLGNVLRDLNLGGEIEVGELALKEKTSERLLSTGIFARWSKS